MKKKLQLFVVLFSCVIYAQGPMTPLSSSVTSGSDWTTTNLTADYAFNFPWEITYAPDGNLWLTEREGEKVVRIGTSGGAITTMIDLSSKVENSKQGGLMGMAIHPALYNDLATTSNNFVYVAYTYADNGLKLRIARLVYNNSTGTLLEDTSLNPNGTILEGLPGSEDHNSGRLIFGPDSKLYYTIGDQGANQFDYACNPILAQVLPTSPTDYANYPGKTLRINLDGSVPSDNPVLNNVQSHVYTYGHRNAQGIIFAQDGTLYNSEHGAKVDDEINIVESGKNYGWPEIAGYYDDMAYTYCNWSTATNCNANDFSDHNCADGADTATEYESYPTVGDVPANFQGPIGTYGGTVSTDPTGGWFTWPTVAPSGIDIHETGNIPGWGRSLLIPTLKKGTIYRAKLTPEGNDIVGDDNQGSIDGYEEFHSSNDRYRDVAISPDGLTIYAITDNSGGTSGPSSVSGVSIENGGTIVKIEYVGTVVSNPPVASCQDITVTLNPDGNATITAADVDNGSTGGSAGIASLVIDVNTFDCSHTTNAQTVWLTVTDNDGNESRCASTVTVNPSASPSPFTVPTLEDVVSNCEITVQAPTLINNACVEITATTTDNTTYVAGESGTITWLFDDGTNSDTVTQNVTVNALLVPTNIYVVPGSTSADVSWDNIEGVTFNVRYREVGSSSWTIVTSAINATTITSLNVATDYELEISSDCGVSESNYSNTVFFTTVAVTYCEARGNNNGQINNVQINGEMGTFISNPSNVNEDYTDFTAISPVSLEAGNAYSLTVATSYTNAIGIAVWIDFNQDGDFEDANEKVWQHNSSNLYSSSPNSKDIMVPATALPGSTRMRIASRQYWVPSGDNGHESCGNIINNASDGEVEDYTVNIINNTLSTSEHILSNVLVYPNPMKDNVLVKLPSTFNYQELTITLFDLQGRVVRRKYVTNSQTEIGFKNLGELNNGVYFMQISADNNTLISKKLIKI